MGSDFITDYTIFITLNLKHPGFLISGDKYDNNILKNCQNPFKNNLWLAFVIFMPV